MARSSLGIVLMATSNGQQQIQFDATHIQCIMVRNKQANCQSKSEVIIMRSSNAANAAYA